MHFDDGPEGPALRIVFGLESGDTVDAIAVMPATPGGEADAEVTGKAILRTMEVIKGTGGSVAIE